MVAGRSAEVVSPARPEPRYIDGARPDQTEGQTKLTEFRLVGIGGTYWLAFDLRVMPRKGKERTVRGNLYGTRNGIGPLSRLVLATQQWLIQAGQPASVWTMVPGADHVMTLLPAEDLQAVAGTDLTIFDLQMPFLYWTDFIYEGVDRIRGRPADSFLLYPPVVEAAARPSVAAVRVWIDTQFQAMMQAEVIGADGRATKTIRVLDLKKVGEQWLVKSIDVRNELTRDKTRLTLTAAALNLDLPEETFLPEGLASPVPAIPASKMERF